MGVDVETIKPGDGKLCSDPTSFSVDLLQYVHRLKRISSFSTAGKTFPKAGQTVVVHYTGTFHLLTH